MDEAESLLEVSGLLSLSDYELYLMATGLGGLE